MGLDTETYWLTDHQSQCDFDFELGQLVYKEKTWNKNSKLEAVTRKRLVKTLQTKKT
jgi:hypothetical protein